MDKVAPEKSGEEFHADQILIVEDEILIGLYMAEELRDAGFIVAEASGAEEAIAVLKSTEEIGLVLTDIRMPGTFDGIALAESGFGASSLILKSRLCQRMFMRCPVPTSMRCLESRCGPTTSFLAPGSC